MTHQLDPFQILGKKYISDGELQSNKELIMGIKDHHYTIGHYPIGHYPIEYDHIRVWELREPTEISDLAKYRGISNDWHHDTQGPGIILWSNMYPTEVKLPNGSIVSGEPYDVVLINNDLVLHRTSPKLVEAIINGADPKRYFIRRTVTHVPSKSEIEDWKNQLKAEFVSL